MITGYQFDRAKVPPLADATVYEYLGSNQNTVIPNIGDGMAVTADGLNLTIGTGKALICGRLVEIASPETVQIPANSNGYLCLTIDLTQSNTSSGTPWETDYTFVINQVRAEFLTSTTTDDLNNGGLIYNFVLGSVTSDAATASFSKYKSHYSDWVIDTIDSQNVSFNGTLKYRKRNGFVSLYGLVTVKMEPLWIEPNYWLRTFSEAYRPAIEVYQTCVAIINEHQHEQVCYPVACTVTTDQNVRIENISNQSIPIGAKIYIYLTYDTVQ